MIFKPDLWHAWHDAEQINDWAYHQSRNNMTLHAVIAQQIDILDKLVHLYWLKPPKEPPSNRSKQPSNQNTDLFQFYICLCVYVLISAVRTRPLLLEMQTMYLKTCSTDAKNIKSSCLLYSESWDEHMIITLTSYVE